MPGSPMTVTSILCALYSCERSSIPSHTGTSKSPRATLCPHHIALTATRLSEYSVHLNRLPCFARARVTVQPADYDVRLRSAARVRYRSRPHARSVSRYRQLRPRKGLRLLARYTGYPVYPSSFASLSVASVLTPHLLFYRVKTLYIRYSAILHIDSLPATRLHSTQPPQTK